MTGLPVLEYAAPIPAFEPVVRASISFPGLALGKNSYRNPGLLIRCPDGQTGLSRHASTQAPAQGSGYRPHPF